MKYCADGNKQGSALSKGVDPAQGFSRSLKAIFIGLTITVLP